MKLHRVFSCISLIACAFFVGISCAPEKTTEGTVPSYPSSGGGKPMPAPAPPSIIGGAGGSGRSCVD
ncbi:hypothetical protein [Candidatus Ichthyocystis sparus]|uniref:hypothetical protein n=1 Tax=Candidatus Ichthyocystis sparus TaxID=1561004 RepID=UPI000B8A4149|nr:hypothetical protein [Candidatus Ichthyocystis sparus]